MTALVISDNDTVQEQITNEPADVLISCGDLSDDVILQIAHALRVPNILVVKGNHDSSAPFPVPIVDLHLTTCTIAGVTFGGFHGSWRYKPRGNYLYDQFEVERLLEPFPSVDVLWSTTLRETFTIAMTKCTTVSLHSFDISNGRAPGFSFTATSTLTKGHALDRRVSWEYTARNDCILIGKRLKVPLTNVHDTGQRS